VLRVDDVVGGEVTRPTGHLAHVGPTSGSSGRLISLCGRAALVGARRIAAGAREGRDARE